VTLGPRSKNVARNCASKSIRQRHYDREKFQERLAKLAPGCRGGLSFRLFQLGSRIRV
jgi:hypothetical protein